MGQQIEASRENILHRDARTSALTKFSVVFLLCCTTLNLFLLERRSGLHLTIEISCPRSSTAQLFYDTGAGFNEIDSRTPNVFAQAPGRFQRLAFALPDADIIRLRLDPTTAAATVVLRNASLSGANGFLFRIPPSDLAPLNQIRSRSQHGNEVIFSTDSAANDPGISLRLHKSPDYMRVARLWRTRSIVIGNCILLVCTILVYTSRKWLLLFGVSLAARLSKLDARFQVIARSLSVPHVIQLDSYAIWFYLACTIVFFGMGMADLNGSSIAIYSELSGFGAPQRALIGSPRGIRSDEWAYATPDILHQSLRSDRFNVQDSARGGHAVALLDSVPVRHFSTAFRPQFWPFFLLPVDYAYAFYWQFKGFILITGVFTWLLLLTRSTFWSVAGSLWLFFSPSTQWSYSWSTGLPEMIGLICWTMVFACVISVAKSAMVQVLAALGIAWFSIDFALCAYLPHLVPLCWLAVLFLAAWCFGARRAIFRRAEAGQRLLAILAAAALIGGVGILVFADVKQALVGIANTGYPGKRVFAGASEKLVVLTSHFMQWTEKEAPLPSVLLNISEASGFLWLAPVTLFCIGRLSLCRVQRLALAALWLCFALILGWLLFPVPAHIARVLLMDKTGGARCVPALGLANIAIVALCMSSAWKIYPKRAIEERSKVYLFSRILALWLIFFVILQLTNALLGSYFSLLTVCSESAFTAALSLLILENRGRILATVLVVSHVIAFGAVNPVERGLGVITNSELYKLVHAKTELLRGKWIVFSQSFASSGFVTAVGCDTYTGMRFLPDIDHLSLFASKGMNTKAFNNSTWLIALPIKSHEKSDFGMVSPVITSWHVSPRDPILRTLGIKYAAFDQPPSAELVSGLTPVSANGPVDHLWLYRLP